MLPVCVDIIQHAPYQDSRVHSWWKSTLNSTYCTCNGKNPNDIDDQVSINSGKWAHLVECSGQPSAVAS